VILNSLSQREREEAVSDALYLDFALEVLQSGNLAVAAAIVPV
jgi:hypothetical protein